MAKLLSFFMAFKVALRLYKRKLFLVKTPNCSNSFKVLDIPVFSLLYKIFPKVFNKKLFQVVSPISSKIIILNKSTRYTAT